MSRTARPASASALRVPPVETSSTPWRGESAREIDEAGLVGDGEQRSRDMAQIDRHGFILSQKSRRA